MTIIPKGELVASSLLMTEALGVLSRKGFNTENWLQCIWKELREKVVRS